jgi:hypothetical protein
MIPLGPRCANCGRQFLGGQPDSRGWCVRCRAAEREQLRSGGPSLTAGVAAAQPRRLAVQELTTSARSRTCEICHRPLIARRPHARTCSAQCRRRLSRRLRKPALVRECPVCHRGSPRFGQAQSTVHGAVGKKSGVLGRPRARSSRGATGTSQKCDVLASFPQEV